MSHPQLDRSQSAATETQHSQKYIYTLKKSFGKMELRSFLKNSRMQYNKMVNTLFNNFLGEKETYVLFLLKNNKGTFWPMQ